tara:strand:- start:4053 stop:4589 length:537 start_codon:yes stop_codon:yes gene_type:complete
MGWLIALWMACVTAHSPQTQTIQNITFMDSFAVGKPQQKAEWNSPPLIRICASTKVSVLRVQKAVSYWRMVGYEFDSIFLDHSLNCGEPRYGEIIVTLPTATTAPNHLASTRIYTEKITGNIAKAKIFIYPREATKQRVMEHEIGHALGWLHHPQKYHIMHPNWHLGGYDSTGLRKKE